MNNTRNKSTISTNTMTKVALLSAISFVMMMIEVPVIFFPEFLKIDLSDIPALIGGFALGPIPGVVIVAIKNILHWLVKSSTGGVGELANFIVGAALVFPASLIYGHEKSRRSALMGMLLGIATMAVAGALANYYILIPFYAQIGMPIELIVDISAKANSAIVDLKSLIYYAIIPFNLIKGSVVTVLTLVIYKKISPVLHK